MKTVEGNYVMCSAAGKIYYIKYNHNNYKKQAKKTQIKCEIFTF